MHAIETSRLRMRTMGPAFLRRSLEGNRELAEELIDAQLPKDWPMLPDLLRTRLDELEVAPEHEPWLTRAIELKAERRIIGVAGFHGAPGLPHLRDYAPSGVEFGCTVLADYRHRGIAVEAGRGLMRWAREEHDVRAFVLSIAPDNFVSKAVAARLGFARVGEWTHEVRGVEHVYLYRIVDGKTRGAEDELAGPKDAALRGRDGEVK